MVKDKNKESRESPATYSPGDATEISDEIKQRFAKDGYALTWIRVKIGTEEDTKNIAKRLSKREGCIFVKPEEAQDLIEQTGLTVGAGGTRIESGDLALAKIRIDLQEARQEYFENMAKNNYKGVTKDLEKDQGRNLRIYNDSKSYTSSRGTVRLKDE